MVCFEIARKPNAKELDEEKLSKLQLAKGIDGAINSFNRPFVIFKFCTTKNLYKLQL